MNRIEQRVMNWPHGWVRHLQEKGGSGYSPQGSALISRTTWEKLSEKPWDMGPPLLKDAESHLGEAHQYGSRRPSLIGPIAARDLANP